MKKENVRDNNILKIVNKIEKLFGEGENNKTIENIKKDYPDKNKKLEEALLIYMGEIDPKILKTGFPDKWK